MGRNEHTYWDISGKLRPGVTALALLLLSGHPLFAQEQLLPVYHFKALEGFGPEGVSARVVRDSLGFVWIGARNGLQRYDGYNFKKYHNIPNEPHSLPSNRISSLLVDSRGRLWVGTEDCGLSLYDPARERFVRLNPNLEDTSRSGTAAVSAMIEDRTGHIWLAMSSPYDIVRMEIPVSGESNDMDSLAASLHFKRFPIGTPGFGANDLCERKDGKLLIASHTGLVLLDPASAGVSRPHLTSPIGGRLDSVLVYRLVQGSDGKLWLGTATEGVFRIDWGTGKVANYRHRKGDSLSITIDQIWDMAEDRRGNMWIGTTHGVELLSPKTGKRIPYLMYEQPFAGCEGIRLSVDCGGTFWVGTASDLYLLTVRSQHFPHFSFWNRWRPQNSPSPQTPGPTHRHWQPLGSFQDIKQAPDGCIWGMSEGKLLEIDPVNRSIIKTIHVFEAKGIKTFGQSSILDEKGNFWHVAWDLGLFKVNLTNGMITNYNYDPPFGKTTTLYSIAQGSGDSLWIGALNQGVFIFSPAGERFLATPFKSGYGVMKDHEGKIWITGDDGLKVFDPVAGTADTFVNVPSDPHSLSRTLPQGPYEDHDGRIWVGGGTVINLWNPATKSFTRYPNPAFSVYDVYPIGSDSKGRLWVVYANGDLSILDPSSGKFLNLSQEDGLCSGITNIVNLGDGNILLSGWAGLNLISADSVEPDRTPPPLVLSRMTINDEPVGPPQLLKGSGSLHLSNTQDVFEFEFAAIDIDPRGPAEYRYQLEGYERDWIKPTDRRYVRYTNIPPGDYVFKVRAASAWDRWPDQEITLAITVAPPWWRTLWAYGGYGLCSIACLFGAYRLRLRQIQLKQAAEMEHFQAEHLAEVDKLKSRFFANISHEFRTPLTLILGPAKRLLERSNDEQSRTDADLIHRSARKLNRLVDELLDIAKIEAGEMKLKARPINIVSAVNDNVLTFQSLAERRKIICRSHCAEREIIVYLDKEMTDKMLTNVLSNAFKFTPEGGTVDVSISSQPSIDGGAVSISIADTGIGIPGGERDRIFDRFYQVDGNHTREQEGTGIGLALTKELVELHKGTIEVESEEGRGSTFTLRFPLGKAHLKPEEIGGEEREDGQQKTILQLEEGVVRSVERGSDRDVPDSSALPSLLIVEDNADVRRYICSVLENKYRIVEGQNGEEGLRKSLEFIPDLIITDIMMPKMDGFQLCGTLKADSRTSHIPVIMLTAKATTDDKINGLEIGADDYIMKPFEAQELEARVRNLIEQRKRLHEHFRTHGLIDMADKNITSVDQKFLRKASEVMNEHIAETSFSVEVFAEEMAVSKSLLLRKMESLLGEPPSELIKRTRLNNAAKLIASKAGNVSEIALDVGFSSPSYFAECFRKQFGCTPTQYHRSLSKPPSGRPGPKPK
jgi:signal transduction histidine kinase/DNA-binding response OmpR family regulator/ligand-binding sensor domain-containing protein